MKKTLALLLAALMLLSGCSGGSAGDTDSASGDAGDDGLREISVVLDWYPTPSTPLSTTPSPRATMKRRG